MKGVLSFYKMITQAIIQNFLKKQISIYGDQKTLQDNLWNFQNSK